MPKAPPVVREIIYAPAPKDSRITLQFVRGTGISSSAIAWFGGGIFSHVDGVLDNGRLLGARSDAVGGAKPGVWTRAPDYEKWKIKKTFTLPCYKAQHDAFYRFAADQIGKPYDKNSIVGFFTGREVREDWRNPSAWFCAELWAAALEESLISGQIFLPVNKVCPNSLAFILSSMGATIS